jgi:hypothetical protein
VVPVVRLAQGRPDQPSRHPRSPSHLIPGRLVIGARPSPRRASPRLASLRLAAPRLAAPRRASPRLASPRLASPHLAWLGLSQSGRPAHRAKRVQPCPTSDDVAARREARRRKVRRVASEAFSKRARSPSGGSRDSTTQRAHPPRPKPSASARVHRREARVTTERNAHIRRVQALCERARSPSGGSRDCTTQRAHRRVQSLLRTPRDLRRETHAAHARAERSPPAFAPTHARQQSACPSPASKAFCDRLAIYAGKPARRTHEQSARRRSSLPRTQDSRAPAHRPHPNPSLAIVARQHNATRTPPASTGQRWPTPKA